MLLHDPPDSALPLEDLRAFLDPIDIHIEVAAVKYRDLASREARERSREIKKRVDDARKIEARRLTTQGFPKM